jgi:hypothetical protein
MLKQWQQHRPTRQVRSELKTDTFLEVLNDTFWEVLGTFWEVLGTFWEVLGTFWEVLDTSGVSF